MNEEHPQKKGLKKSTWSTAEIGGGASEDIENVNTLIVIQISSALTTLKTRNKSMTTGKVVVCYIIRIN